MGGPSLEHDPRRDVAEAAELKCVVGRLEADHERGRVDDRRRLEHRRKRIRLRPEFLPREEEEAEVVGQLGLCGPCGELHHHRETALHVARAAAVDGAVLDPAGDIAVDRDGVCVPREEHERPARLRRVDQRLAVVVDEWESHVVLDVAVDLGLVPGDRRDVDERERPGGESLFGGGGGHNAA